jgi:hypothetical protein
MADSQDQKLKAYEQLCSSYRAIDDFRAKLLGFLPLEPVQNLSQANSNKVI